VKLAPDTPRALYRGEWVFFCLHMCKEDFDRNPATSCLAARLLVDK
jgi:YHS domain-containing protein